MAWSNRVEPALAAMVETGALAGAATLVWRRGGAPERACAGWRVVEERVAMTPDTIFRIASMTKPITSVAALMLLEEGRFGLDEPITRWAPELARMRVLRSPSSSLADTVPAERPMTFADLLTHRSGLTYGPFHPGALARAYEVLGGDIDSHLSPDAWIAALSTIPLVHQPGEVMHYGHSTDLLGLLIARMEDAPLGDVLTRRILGPLGMRDTGFVVPPERHARRAALYGFDDSGRRVRQQTCPGGSTVPERPADMTFMSGGQGLWSTLDDYLAFARLFVEGGEVDGVRLLAPETLTRMVTNHLTAAQRARSDVGGMPLFAAGHGFGMGVAVVLEPDLAAPTVVGGHAGAVGWPGGFGGWWRADPVDGSVMIFLAHNLVEREQFARGIGFGVYEAITTFQSHVATAR